jgi:radical SAM family uncharacterized protein
MNKSIDQLLFDVSKPSRYTGSEWNSIIKNWDATPIKVALSFPDLYEIGMSNLAIPILYKILNDQNDVLAERVFAPWVDMEATLRSNGIPLYSLETKRPLIDFDIIGFSLGYELTYTNILNMLDLAKIPAFSAQRNQSYPLIIAGGSCSLNPEPVADFFDLFVIGEAEETILSLIEVFRNYRSDKSTFLRQAAKLPGIYVPSLYEVEYNEDGSFARISPKATEAKTIIERQIVTPLPHPVTNPVVPYIEVIHDRGAIEVQRGCSRGCRFCQAGIIYRPVRELPHQEVIDSVEALMKNCGYNDISLVSLSTGDYNGISELITQLSHKFQRSNLSVSLPSLRIDRSSINLIESLPQKRKTTLTFAPEAGSERLRYAINKVISEELILDTLATVFEKGWMNLKLYFMIGLPTETIDDIKSIVELVSKIRKVGKKSGARPPNVRVSISTFVPKTHTPCQWSAQIVEEQIYLKQDIVREGLRRTGIHLSWQNPKISLLEAALSRGDRRLGKVIHRAWELGCKFDTWNEHFNYQNWMTAFQENGVDPAFFANRERPLDEPLPWQHIDVGVSSNFLKRECGNMSLGKDTPDCRYGDCSACGLHLHQENCQRMFKELRNSKT